MKYSILFLVLMVKTSLFYSQTFTAPNYALKSHETLNITKIEANSEKTIVYLSVVNQRIGGYFCADRNISLSESDGGKLKLLKSSGIPVCPDTYKFQSIGEKLDFILTFPPLKPGTEWVDLIEECSENCFSFYGVILDNSMNRRIDGVFALAENGEQTKALISFINIAAEKDIKSPVVEGLIYINIIKLANDTGNLTKAAEWYNRLKSSAIPRAELYIKHLNLLGIKF